MRDRAEGQKGQVSSTGKRRPPQALSSISGTFGDLLSFPQAQIPSSGYRIQSSLFYKINTEITSAGKGIFPQRRKVISSQRSSYK